MTTQQTTTITQRAVTNLTGVEVTMATVVGDARFHTAFFQRQLIFGIGSLENQNRRKRSHTPTHLTSFDKIASRNF
jgi:hypothetical protein